MLKDCHRTEEGNEANVGIPDLLAHEEFTDVSAHTSIRGTCHNTHGGEVEAKEHTGDLCERAQNADVGGWINGVVVKRKADAVKCGRHMQEPPDPSTMREDYTFQRLQSNDDRNRDYDLSTHRVENRGKD